MHQGRWPVYVAHHRPQHIHAHEKITVLAGIMLTLPSHAKQHHVQPDADACHHESSIARARLAHVPGHV